MIKLLLIIHHYAFRIMPLRRANTRNSNTDNVDASPHILNHAFTNVKFQSLIQLLARSVPNQNNY